MSRIVFTDVDVGDQKTITATFVDAAGAAADGTVVVRLLDPAAVETTPTVVHGATGSYSFTQTYDQPLSWYGRFEATGALIDAVDFEVRVNTTPFYP